MLSENGPPLYHHQGLELSLIYGVLLQIYPKICMSSPNLHELVSGKNAGKKQVAIIWNDRCQLSFDDLNHLCTIAPILGYANFMKPFKLHTDACRSGLEAVLYQIYYYGTNAINTYASRGLPKADTHYPAHKLKFLTLKWAMVKKFLEYLYASTFDVYTNKNSLLCILMMDAMQSMLGGYPCQL